MKNNQNFWSYGIGLLLYINTIFELDLFYLGLRVSEICIVVILLFVIIFIFNEINKLLRENYPAVDIKYFMKSNNYAYIIDVSEVVIEKVFNKTENLKLNSSKSYISLISLL